MQKYQGLIYKQLKRKNIFKSFHSFVTYFEKNETLFRVASFDNHFQIDGFFGKSDFCYGQQMQVFLILF